MAFRMIIVFLVIVTIGFICYAVEGDKFAKEVFTTIKSEYGDIYDCVDIYKQPSLNHPLLKDHKIQMSPSKRLKDKLARLPQKKRNDKIIDVNIGLKKGCPPGTVPIRQYSSKHLKRARLASQKHQLNISSKWDRGLEVSYIKPFVKDNVFDNIRCFIVKFIEIGDMNCISLPLLLRQFSLHASTYMFAGLQTTATTSPSNEFVGAAAVMSLYNPKVGPNQFSSAMMSFEGGDPPTLNQIQVGWTVNPKLYGDTRTRLFTSWTADNHQKTGCFNIQCPGFVQVDSNIPLDFAFSNISIVNEVAYEMGLYVNQDIDKKWWLYTWTHIHAIGYWPPTLFTSMATYANTIKWGGQIFTPWNEDSSPQMGSGVFNNGRYDRTCYMNNVLYANSTGIPSSPDDSIVKTLASRCFVAADGSYKDEQVAYSFLFGGGGGEDHSYTCDY